MIGIFAGAAVGAGWLATNTPIGLGFLVYVLVAGALLVILPLLAYQAYALQSAVYRLDRDKLVLQWGLRQEKIPISDIEWVRPLNALETSLSLPPLRLPGVLSGVRHVNNLGTVEFMASEVPLLLLVATRQRIFAISPAEPLAFVQNLQNAIEMGSLSAEAPASFYPSFVVVEAWREPVTRYFWLAALFLNIGLLGWVSLSIPNLQVVSLGFLPSGQAGEKVPAVGLLLLPILSLALSAAGWLLGLAVYRRPERRLLAQILWANNVVSTVLFLMAVLFLLSVS
ncbi:MAG: PH domain-containing protein [Anaerolineales bacterium]|nr:PH domain-containing protein [Anaerolineales bacterium]MCX7607646.1 PH domain-containing protein [Anaerolineales bacterium]